MTAPVGQLITAEEFLRLPNPPSGGKMELIEGMVVLHMPVGGPHGELALAIGSELRAFVRRHRLGAVGVEVGFTLSRRPDTNRAPDVHFVSSERLEGGRMPAGFFDGHPDLAVEIVSPDDSELELAEKVRQYLTADTPRAWVVRPRTKTVEVHRPGRPIDVLGTGATLTSEHAGFAVEGFALPLDDLFA